MSGAWLICCLPRFSFLSSKKRGAGESKSEVVLRGRSKSQPLDAGPEAGGEEGAEVVGAGDPSIDLSVAHGSDEPQRGKIEAVTNGRVSGGEIEAVTNARVSGTEVQGAVMEVVPIMNEKAEAPVERVTHIHDLTEDCLLIVLSLVGNAELPIKRPKYVDVQVSHPLQCTLVCQRWRSCARQAVHSLSLRSLFLRGSHSAQNFASQATHFTALRWLSLFIHGSHCALLPIARATPLLEYLGLHLEGHCPVSDVSSALRYWTHIKELCLEVNFRRQEDQNIAHVDQSTVLILDILPAARSVEILSLGLSVSHVVDSSQPPFPSIAAFPSLKLRLTSLPSHVLALRNVIDLHLENIHNQQELPVELGSMVRLESLTLKNMFLLSTLPSSLGKLSALKSLEIEDCLSLETLPSSLGQMRALEFLSVKHCSCFATLPSTLGQLSALKVLKVKDCSRFGEVPASTGNLRALAVLHLSKCGKLESLPESHAQLTSIEELHLVGSRGRSLPSSLDLRGMQKLRDLEVTDWTVPSMLPENFGEPRLLSRLTLNELTGLKDLSDSLGNWRSLQELHMERLDTLGGLPDSLCQLSRLESIEIVACGIASLPEALGQLCALRRFCMIRCSRVRGLPASMGNLSSLNELRLESCQGLRDIPLELAHLTDLRELVIRDCYMFYDKMNCIPKMKGLRFLELEGCKLQYFLPEGLEKLASLQVIKCSPGMIELACVFRQFSEDFLDKMVCDSSMVSLEVRAMLRLRKRNRSDVFSTTKALGFRQ